MPCCGLNGKDAIDVTKSLRSDRHRSLVGVGHDSDCRAGARKAARGASVARLWFPARLPHTRADRSRRGATCQAGLVVWRPGLLSRALERRRLRAVLDPDADWKCMELR